MDRIEVHFAGNHVEIFTNGNGPGQFTMRHKDQRYTLGYGQWVPGFKGVGGEIDWCTAIGSAADYEALEDTMRGAGW